MTVLAQNPGLPFMTRYRLPLMAALAAATLSTSVLRPQTSETEKSEEYLILGDANRGAGEPMIAVNLHFALPNPWLRALPRTRIEPSRLLGRGTTHKPSGRRTRPTFALKWVTCPPRPLTSRLAAFWGAGPFGPPSVQSFANRFLVASCGPTESWGTQRGATSKEVGAIMSRLPKRLVLALNPPRKRGKNLTADRLELPIASTGGPRSGANHCEACFSANCTAINSIP